MLRDDRFAELLGIAYNARSDLQRRAAKILLAIVANDHGHERLKMAEAEDPDVAEELKTLSERMALKHLIDQ